MAQKAAVSSDAPDAKQIASQSAFCLLRIKEDGNFLEVYRRLYAKKDICACDAVREYYDIVIRLNCKSNEQEGFILSNVMGIQDVREAVCLPVLNPEKDRTIETAMCEYEIENGLNRQDYCPERGEDMFLAYVLVEVEKGRLPEVYPRLYFTEGVVSCDITDGPYNLVLLLQSRSFTDLEQILVEDIRSVQGISRTRMLQVTNLFDWVKGSQGGEPVFPRINRELWRFRGEPGQIIPLLQSAQDSYGYVPEVAIKNISGVTGRPESEIYGVITFYKQFRLRPLGKYLVRLCDGTACHVNNSKMLRGVVEDELKLEGGEDTTSDGLFTLEPVACLGCCSLAPVVMVNETTHASLTAKKVRSILRNYRAEGKTAAQGKGE